MRKLIIKLLPIVIILGFFSACNSGFVSGPDSPDTVIKVAAGGEFTISTKPNASTGWMLWLKGYDSNFVTLVENKAVPDVFRARTYIFKALQKGKTEIQMQLKPYWWDEIPPDKQKEYPVETTIFYVTIN